MNTSITSVILYLVIGLFAASCATMQPGAGVRDDIYYMPSDAPLASSPKQQGQQAGQQGDDYYADDYYDPGTAKNYSTRSYYDMAYNDPYYYNYGRFGFGGGMGMGMGMGMMGWQSGWGGPGWGMGMGYGWGHPMGMGGMGMGYGMYDPWYGGWGNPYMNPWGRPYGMGMGMGMYDPYMGGYGWGNYYGPYGNCFACYAPVVVGGSSGIVVGHRPSVGSGIAPGGSGNNVHQPRSTVFRDPVGLTPATRMDDNVRSSPGSVIDRGGDRRSPTYGSPSSRPDRQPVLTRPGREGGGRDIQRGGGIDRGGGFDRGGGAPSRSGGGGGSRPTISSPRPR